MANRPGKHRLQIDIPEIIWNELKAVAEKKNISITTLILQMTLKMVLDEKKYE